MDKNGLLIVLLFLLLFVFGPSNAFNSRKLVTTADPNASSNANQDSPLSSQPPPDLKKQNPSPIGAPEPKDTPTKNQTDVESNKGLKDTNTGKTSGDDKTVVDKGKDEDAIAKVEDRVKTFSTKRCKGNPICSDKDKTMVACIQSFKKDSNNLTLVVQNERDKTMKVNISFATSTNQDSKAVEIPAIGTAKVIMRFPGDKSTKVILNGGNGDCELQIDQIKTIRVDTPSKPKGPENSSNLNTTDNNPTTNPPVNPKDTETPKKPKEPTTTPTNSKEVENAPSKPNKVNDTSTSNSDSQDVVDNKNTPENSNVETSISQNNFLEQLSFYSKQVTPTYGAYFAFLVALLIGGSWALCTFRKRRTNGGVAYQELEMGLPESSNAVDVETVEGWDQDWDDDDWDEDKAIRSPGGGVQSKNISSNGLTSRSTKKDGWDADWDD